MDDEQKMSGGSLDYFTFKFDEPIHQIKYYYDNLYCPLHGRKPDAELLELTQKLVEKLRQVQKVLYDIEWVMSGDKSDGDEFQAVREFLGEK